MDSLCLVNKDGKHSGTKGDHEWRCSACLKVLVPPCEVGVIPHSPARMVVCVSCDVLMIQCDYCSESALLENGAVPADWLASRFRGPHVEGQIDSIIRGPTACPYHVEQLKKVISTKA